MDNFALVSISRKQNVLNSISYSNSTYSVNAKYQPNINIPTRILWQHYNIIIITTTKSIKYNFGGSQLLQRFS